MDGLPPDCGGLSDNDSVTMGARRRVQPTRTLCGIRRYADRVSERKPDASDARADGHDRGGKVGAEVRERVDALGVRFEEPVRAVAGITQKTMALFPVRVWRRFLAANGFLLSSGISYQALFATFAAVYVFFAVAGIWLAESPEALTALITVVNTYVPGLISVDGSPGAISVDTLLSEGSTSTSLFGLTGAIALAGFIWTAIGWMTYSRTAVRSIFGLPKDDRAYVLLKARDLVASLLFGALLLVGAALSVASTSAIEWLLGLVGVSSSSLWAKFLGGTAGFIVVFVIDALVLIAMFRFLSGAAITWRRLLGGSLLGAGALVVLQVGGSFLVGGATSNPLLATFTVFIGLLLWFRLSAIVTLVAAAFIYTAARDRNESLRLVTPAQLEVERAITEHNAKVVTARIAVRDATDAVTKANWITRPYAKRVLAAAQNRLADLEAWTPPTVRRKSWLAGGGSAKKPGGASG